MNPVRVAIVGVGNCASSLVQGVEYYKDAAADSEVFWQTLRAQVAKVERQP